MCKVESTICACKQQIKQNVVCLEVVANLNREKFKYNTIIIWFVFIVRNETPMIFIVKYYI